MESDLLPTAGGIKGINLDNYFPNQRSYNSVVYYHKKFLKDAKEEKHRKTKVGEKAPKLKKKNVGAKHDKMQQFNNEACYEKTNKISTAEEYYNPVLHTLRFAKNLVPLVIPPAKDSSSPIYYTIKTSKKVKKQDIKHHEPSTEKDLTYSKEKMHKFEAERKRKTKSHRESARESIDHSSQNTLDDINLNINQSCSFSESTEVKYYKKEHTRVANENTQKYFVSNSFDALATESMNGGDSNKIKIHLMNDSDKALFSESIKNPIINAIKDCLSQLTNNHEINTEIKTVQRNIKSNNKKLDEVLERLTCLERRIKSTAQLTPRVETTPLVRSAKASKLEELSEDLIVVKEDKLSEEDFSEEYNIPKRRLRCSGKSVVVAINEHCEREDRKKKETTGCGEEVPGNDGLNVSSSISQQALKPERPNRIPARFCWTDADRLK